MKSEKGGNKKKNTENTQAVRPSYFERAADRSGAVDWVLIAVTVVLVAFGLVMIYSASAYTARIEYGSSVYYLKKQLTSLAIGAVAAVICVFLPLKLWKAVSFAVYVVSLAAVLLTLTSLGIESGGATRWLNLKVFTLQPAELVKIGLILSLALILCLLKDQLAKPWTYILMMAVIAAGAGLVAVVTDDLGTAVVIFAIGLIMVFVLCPRPSYIVITICALAGVVAILILMKPYRMERIYAWLNPAAYADDESYQIVQALYAIGSGGLIGKGLGKSTQKLGYVPESQSDMIFSIICEELGIVGACFLLLLFGILIWRLWRIFCETVDLYSKLVVVGVMSHIGFQTVLNLWVVTGLSPNTGVPLPFISYGGSSIIVLLAEIGMVIGISRQNYKNALKNPKKIREDKSRGVIYV